MSKTKDVIIAHQQEVISWLKEQVIELQSANLQIAKAYAEAYANAVGKFAPDPALYATNQSSTTSYDVLSGRFAAASDNGDEEDLLEPVDPDQAERRQDVLSNDEDKKAADGNVPED